MIYIDPPYNTGNDFIYEDDFAENKDEYFERSLQKDEEGNRLVANNESNGRFHSDWLSMLYPRLKLARNLLRDDGVIFISIDDGEVAGLLQVCNEVFGKENHVETFVWKKSYGGGPKEKYAVTQHEYVLLFAKMLGNLSPFSLKYDQAKVVRYYKGRDEHFEIRGPFRLKPLEATKSMDSRPNLIYGIPSPDGDEILPKRQWLWSRERVLKTLATNGLEFVGSGESRTVNYKQYLRDEHGIERGEKPFSLIDGIYTQHGTEDIRRIFDRKVMVQFPKPVELIRRFMEIVITPRESCIVLDFFSGSSTTAHAVMQLNAEDGGNRKFIMVQLPEETDEKSEAFKAGYKTIAEIGKERIRRAGKKIKEELEAKQVENEMPLLDKNSERQTQNSELDTGFRVLKIDSSNMKDVYYSPDAVEQGNLLDQIGNVKEDRTDEDLLFQVLLDWGVDLAVPVAKETILEKTIYFVDENALVACFDTGITEELVKELAKHKPLRAVFRDSGFESDNVKINVEQIFKLMSPETEVKSI